MKKCLNCGYEGRPIDFFNYQETNYPKEKCPVCSSDKIIEKESAVSGIMCPFCHAKEIRFLSYNSTREDVYFSTHLTCCEDEECINALKKRVVTHNNNPSIISITSFSPASFFPRGRKKAEKFLREIRKNRGRMQKSS